MKPEKTALYGFYLLHMVANLIGFGAALLLDFFTPVYAIKVQGAFLFTVGGWLLLVLLPLLVFLLICCLQCLIQRPVSKCMAQIRIGKEIPGGLAVKAKRRLLNLPFVIPGLDLIAWIALPALILAFLHFLNDMPAIIIIFLFFRFVMIGLITGIFSFLLIENHSRKKAIPMLFPEGRLAEIPGTAMISIRTRIRVLFLAETAIPTIIFTGTLLLALWNIEGRPVSALDFGLQFFVFTLIAYGIFIFMALSLNSLVGKSIIDPLAEILKMIGKVKGGNFNERIHVVSNDETGILADAGNDMVLALRERERIRETFGKYVTPEIRDMILAGRVPLNGERTQATVLFADLRGFTRYVEAASPEAVIKSMRAYFTAMQRAIRFHQGLVLQYAGDEIEAVFGVPLKYDDHAQKAVLAALEMRKSLKELNRRRIEQNMTPFRHGIGIHTGEVLAGNTGSEDQLSYALIGDTVNMASRIEGLTKKYRCDILASEETLKGFKGPLKAEKQPPIRVKGFSSPITTYRIIG
ncbi:adenylate and Guanylate cyclase catalytic domain protein [delta proteobacterium NaphS2]|nr:adenylate and Guanylate cyclase catalytic domain protein [delta proteobacterium NaphS2]